jgi:hypothetical protein
MDRSLMKFIAALVPAVIFAACSPATTRPPGDVKARPALPPEPILTYSASAAQTGQRIEHGELILDVDGREDCCMLSTIRTRCWRPEGCRGRSRDRP